MCLSFPTDESVPISSYPMCGPSPMPAGPQLARNFVLACNGTGSLSGRYVTVQKLSSGPQAHLAEVMIDHKEVVETQSEGMSELYY